jgi:alkaline phosphatase D
MRMIWIAFLAAVSLDAQTPTSAPPPPKQPERSVTQLVRSGPMLGYAQLTEAAIWLQTTTSADVQIRFWNEGDPRRARLSRVIRTEKTGDHIARFILSDLEFGTRYGYEVYVDGLRLDRSDRMSFQTLPMWKHRGDPPPFRFAIGSCAYINDPPYDRPGKPYGDKMEIFSQIVATKPDFMIWLGDNVYYREGDWISERGMRARWAKDRSLPQLQALLASVHHYATWDDHDYGPNNSDRTYPLRRTALEVFRDYWANQTYGLEETPGVFSRFVWNDVEFFLLDDRYHRSPNLEDPARRQMLGPAQMEWLLESLRSSDAKFKIVVNGNQMLNPLAYDETFNDFPVEQKVLFDFLRESGVEGVVFLSGDKHHTELIRRTDIAPYPLYDLTVSPLTAGVYLSQKEAENPARVPGTIVAERNFATVDVSGPAGDRRLVIRDFDWSGKELWSHTIRASELKPPASGKND